MGEHASFFLYLSDLVLKVVEGIIF
jgi:hypothetical protein